MKLYNKNKNKWKFPFFANFTKKINDNYFSGFALYKNALLTFIIFKHVNPFRPVHFRKFY